jgi:hypothetical protein
LFARELLHQQSASKMARGIFLGKSRAPEAIEIISNPVLKYSDALPRTDLRDVESVANNSRPVNRAVAQWDFQRPRTADGRKPIKKGQGLNPGFDFQITVPPAEAVPLPKSPDDDANANMIGIALGSPRMAQPQSILSQMQEQPPVSTSASSEQVSPQTKPPKRKPSKWRKIGGLFKAKNGLAATPNQPFYQVRCNEEWPLQESTHSVDYEHQCKADKLETENLASTPPNPPSLEIWPCPDGENEPKSYIQSNLETAPQDSAKNKDLPPSAKRTAGPFLQIDIPDVQLERYSVMFGGVLNQNEPSLLKRRSKTLEDVRIPKPGVCILILRNYVSLTEAVIRHHHRTSNHLDAGRHRRNHDFPASICSPRNHLSVRRRRFWVLRTSQEALALSIEAKHRSLD